MQMQLLSDYWQEKKPSAPEARAPNRSPKEKMLKEGFARQTDLQ
jgi:hypothetical protein